MPRSRLRAASFSIAVMASVAVLGVPGCKSSQEAGKGMQAEIVDGRIVVPVELDDYVIRMPTTIPPGTIDFNVKNVGTHVHNVKIVGDGVNSSLAENLQAGQSAVLTLPLNPGVYRVTCPIGPHAALGMRLDLTVTD